MVGNKFKETESVSTEAVAQKFREIYKKHLCWKFFFNKVTGRPHDCNFIKKETVTKVFCGEFYEIHKNTFFHRTPPAAASVSVLVSVKLSKQGYKMGTFARNRISASG